MEYTVMEQYWIWLSSVEGIGPKRFYQLLSFFEDPRTVWDNINHPFISGLGQATAAKLRAARNEYAFHKLFSRLEQTNTRAIPMVHADYPSALGSIIDPPTTLYVRGNADLCAEKAIGIVGSRRSTKDGQRAAEDFARGLAEQGVTVVSGLARGIDSFAHTGAIKGKGATIACLGCGADVVYPPENEALYRQILDNGGALVSEYPPGTQPTAGHFPLRNRIISGLTSGTLLVEAAKGSGAMITVEFAIQQGRDVFVVPGSIYSSLSSMPNSLMQQGAQIALSYWDILEYYRWASREQSPMPAADTLSELDETERCLVEPLLAEPLSFDDLQRITGIMPAKLNSHLTTLILRGIIVKAPGGMYRAYISNNAL